MIETWKPTTRGGHHVRNVRQHGLGWSGEVCLRTDCLPSVDPKDWQRESWYSDGTYYGGSPKSELDLVAINPGETTMDWKERIKQWAADRNLIEGSTPTKQFVKLIEEVGELARAIQLGYQVDTEDAIGDIQVVLCIMCHQLSIDIDECREIAWSEIKDRKGKMVDGVFVKELQGD